jgi:hypothetical protein
VAPAPTTTAFAGATVYPDPDEAMMRSATLYPDPDDDANSYPDPGEEVPAAASTSGVGGSSPPRRRGDYSFSGDPSKKEEPASAEKGSYSAKSEGDYVPTGKPIETQLYDVLGIAPDATSSQVLLCVCILSKSVHVLYGLSLSVRIFFDSILRAG